MAFSGRVTRLSTRRALAVRCRIDGGNPSRRLPGLRPFLPIAFVDRGIVALAPRRKSKACARERHVLSVVPVPAFGRSLAVAKHSAGGRDRRRFTGHGPPGLRSHSSPRRLSSAVV